MAQVKRKKPEKLPKRIGTDEDPLVTKWRRRIDLAESERRKVAGDNPPKEGKWADLIKFYKGDQWKEVGSESEGEFHKVTANKAKSAIGAVRPQLYFKNPRVNITIENPYLAPDDVFEPDLQTDPSGNTPLMQPAPGPDGQPVIDPNTGQPAMQPVIKFPKGTPLAVVGGEMVNAQEQVDLLEGIDNYWMKKCGLKHVVKRNINDAKILPFGVAKFYWLVETEKVMNAAGKEEEKVVNRRPMLERVKPWLFFWDTELDELDLKQANWVFEKKFVSAQDIKEDASLKLDKNDWEEIGDPELYVDSDIDEAKDDEDRKSDMGRYCMYEIHDLRQGEFMVWIKGMKKMARQENPSAYDVVEGSIYTVLGFEEPPDDAMPIPPLAGIKSLNQAYNWMRSYQVNHAARMNRRYKMLEGTMTPEEKRKWERGADNTTIVVQSMNGGPDPVQEAPAPSDTYAVADILDREITLGIGVTKSAQGTKEAGVDTATEASYIQGGMDIRVEEDRDTVKDFVTELVRKLNILLKTYMTTDSAVQIAGPAGKKWVKWSKDDIQGEFLEDVDIYSAMPFSEDVEKKQAMEFFSLVAADPYYKPIPTRKIVNRMMKYDDYGDILYTEAEMQQMQAQQAQANPADAQEGQKQASKTLRPSEGQVRRKSDRQGDILGGAKRR